MNSFFPGVLCGSDSHLDLLQIFQLLVLGIYSYLQYRICWKTPMPLIQHTKKRLRSYWRRERVELSRLLVRWWVLILALLLLWPVSLAKVGYWARRKPQTTYLQSQLSPQNLPCLPQLRTQRLGESWEEVSQTCSEVKQRTVKKRHRALKLIFLYYFLSVNHWCNWISKLPWKHFVYWFEFS